MQTFIQQIYDLESGVNVPVIFLDRDGTLIEEVSYLQDFSQVKFLPGVLAGLRLLQTLGALLIIVTNQPVVAKGFATITQVKKIHNLLVEEFKKEGIQIHAIYFCPHHPNADMKSYRIICRCRKPGIAMFEKAIKTFSLDLKKTAVIGDHFRDIEAGKRLGVLTCAITSDKKLASLSDFHYTSFLSTAQRITEFFYESGHSRSRKRHKTSKNYKGHS